MGASAGGFEAFQGFFKKMPADSGAAFVLVLHLDPRHETLVPELLGRSTTMPVQQVQDGMAVQPNHVYVIPPNARLQIQRGSLRLTSPIENTRGVRTPIDEFFRSLAEDHGELAICILLSGSGSDGTLGLRAVKEQGGMAMAQTAETAKHSSIPQSAIATGLVDYVLPVDAMPAKLMEYLDHLREIDARAGAEDIRRQATDQLGKICALLRRRTGHDFSQYKQATLVRRIQRRMMILHVPTVATYVQRLRTDNVEVEQLFKDLLIGVTHFFRDPEAFQVLGGDVIPRLLDRAGPEGVLRIWTPGCATGEEAYSVAILLREQLASRDWRTKVTIFAGDIDDEALETARHARYPEGIAAHISRERLARFFQKQEHSYVVAKEIREMCIFSAHNLIKDPPFSRLDLIVCRNLLIYLEAELQKLVAQLFHYSLRPGGYLFLGPSENLAGPADLFRTLDKKNRIFQRNETMSRPAVPITLRDGSRAGEPAEPRTLPAVAPKGSGSAPIHVLERILIDHYSPAWVVVNARGETVYFSPRTGRYLEPAAGAPSADLVGMARPGLRPELRAAIHRAQKTGDVVLRQGVEVETNGDLQRINLSVRPLKELGPDSNFHLVLFQELGPPRSKRAAAEAERKRPGETVVEQLEAELRTTKEHLQTTVEELESSNEELTSSNEELLSTNEELQSSNEELQTSKEELQSVNEELETINSELKNKIEELDEANSDLHNLFASTQIATLFLDRELRVKRFTPAATDVFRLIDTDVGRPIADIAPRVTGADLVDDMNTVLRTLQVRERSVRTAESGRQFIMRILPYRRGDQTIDGVVANFVDVTELTGAQSQQARLAAIVEASPDAIVGRTLDGAITSWNPSAEKMFGFSAADAIGRSVEIVVPPEQRADMERVNRAAAKSEEVPPFESVRVGKDGRHVPVSVSISEIREDGRVTGIASSYRDLSEVARAKQALADELRRKDAFLAMLSHELRNPLAPLRACLDILNAAAADTDQSRRAREMIGRQVGQLTAIVNDLLDVSRVINGKISLARQPLDLAQLVSELVDDQQAEQRKDGPVRLKLQRPERAVWVEADPTRLSQAIGNVLHNAVKFTEEGSVEVTLKVERDGQAAVLRIKDSGVGMDGPTLGRVFDPFSQAERSVGRSRGGLGLGLALAKGLIAAHGGSIQAASDGPEKGSEFVIRLPLSKPPAREAAPPRTALAAEPGAARPRRVLIVEDFRDAAESLALLLELAGHTVKMVHDGESALAAARDFRPDVVLCDVGLPGDMDGYAVAKAFRSDGELRHVRLVALTGYGREDDIARSAEAGFEIHASKPIEADSLRRLLAELPDTPPKK
jgi:two-component system CheB/CheR fusion protein